MTPDPRPLPLPELASTWRTRAAELRRVADAEGAARALESAAAELDATLASESDRLLTIREAAALTGRAPETLRKAIREGRIPNAGLRVAPGSDRAISGQSRPGRLAAIVRRAVSSTHALMPRRSWKCGGETNTHDPSTRAPR